MSGLPGPVQASWPEGRWAQAARSLLPLARLGGCRAAGRCVHWCFVLSSRGRDLPAPLVAWISQALVCLCSRDSIRRSSFTGCRLRSCRSGAGAALGCAMCVPARHVAVIPGAGVRTLSLLLRSQPENTCQSAAVHPALAQPPQEGGCCLREQFKNALSNTC